MFNTHLFNNFTCVGVKRLLIKLFFVHVFWGTNHGILWEVAESQPRTIRVLSRPIKRDGDVGSRPDDWHPWTPAAMLVAEGNYGQVY